MRVALFGHRGKVGRVLAPALEAHGHAVSGVDAAEDVPDADVAVDFTRPDAAVANIARALARGLPVIVGTTGFDREAAAAAARDAGLAVFYAPNFALGAVLMMRFAEEAGRYFPRAEIIELHAETKVDAPSGTAKATAERLHGDTPIHSVRLPGLVAHQEVLFGGDGQLLTIRHDTYTRDAFVPGVLLALERIRELPPGLTVGLERLLRH